MGDELRKSGPALLALLGGAAVIAALARIGIVALDATGALGYNYRAATAPYLTDGLTTLDKLPFTLTGGTLVGFVFAGGLALCLATAAALLFAHVLPGEGEGHPGTALVWGFATAVVGLACLVVVVLGLYSTVLLSQMTKGGGGALGVIAVMLVLAVGTLVAAACAMTRAAFVRARRAPLAGARFALLAILACGAVTCVFVVLCFNAVNAADASTAAIVGSFGAACVANLAMLAAGAKLG